MKKSLLVLLLTLSPGVAFGQCTGVFPNNTICGNVSGSPNIPGAVSNSVLTGVPGGTNGQIQYNNNGAFGGFTASGDATVNTTTGSVAVGKTGGVAFAPSATTDTTNASNISSGTLSLNRQTSVVNVASVKDYGATGDCSTNDTSAFQSAWNAAKASGGQGVVYVPPVGAGLCYKVGAINGTSATGVTVRGNGSQSLIKIIAKDGSNNWWDLTGSNQIVFDSLRIIKDGSVVPDNVFLWAWNNGGVLTSGLSFYRVDLDVDFVKSGLTAFGFTGGGNTSTEGNSTFNSKGLVIRDSTWYGRYVTGNGAQTDPSLRSALLRVDAQNLLSATSANATIGPGSGVAWDILLDNFNAIDAPAAGFTNGDTRRAAIICNLCGAVFKMIGGSVQALADAPLVFWNSPEGIEIIGIRIGASDINNATVLNYGVRLGGCTCGHMIFQMVFFTGTANAAWFGIDNPGPLATQTLGRFNLIAPEFGGGAVPAMTTTGLACTLPNTPGSWINDGSRLDLGGKDVTFCGDVDFTVMITGNGTISNSNPGTQLTGCKFRPTVAMACDTTQTP